jgi:ubiquinone/menaquinone biosynthesis C-methylase UbiE
MKENPEEVVDLGCGEGIFLDAARKFNQKISTIGVDLSRKNCKKTAKKHDAICGDVEFLPFKTNSVDVVFLLDVLEHLFEHNVLSEIYRILKDDGDLLLSTPNKFGIYEHKQLVYAEALCQNPQDIWNTLKGKPRNYAPYHVRLYSNKKLTQVLQDHGFLILESTTEGFCFPFLGSVKNFFSAFKKEYVLEERIRRHLEIFEKKLEIFNWLIIVHARKNSKKG